MYAPAGRLFAFSTIPFAVGRKKTLSAGGAARCGGAGLTRQRENATLRMRPAVFNTIISPPSDQQ